MIKVEDLTFKGGIIAGVKGAVGAVIWAFVWMFVIGQKPRDPAIPRFFYSAVALFLVFALPMAPAIFRGLKYTRQPNHAHAWGVRNFGQALGTGIVVALTAVIYLAIFKSN